jgi:RNA polymerase sigma factor (sigma-70 family)
MPTMRCRNATCAPFGISTRITDRRSSHGSSRSCGTSATRSLHGAQRRNCATLKPTPKCWKTQHRSGRRSGIHLSALLRELDAATIRRLVAALPTQFREAIVLREINDLSYREIADVIGAPVGTVMSRLARARFMLRAAWNAEEGLPA